MNDSEEETAWEDDDIASQLPGLQEILAEHVHNKWAEGRLREGWRYGTERNDANKLHPGLVPYDELAESEKAYDRATAFETLRTVLRHGYQIIPPTNKQDPASGGREASDALIAAHSQMSVSELVTSFRAMPAKEKYGQLPFAIWVIARLLEYSEPLLAFDLVSEALEAEPGHLKLMQLKGLALARSGAAQKANQLFKELFENGHRDEETVGNLARSYKSLWETARSVAVADDYLKQALDCYELSHQLTGGYWSAINVAFLALMQGDERLAHERAEQVGVECKQLLESQADPDGRYWLLATVAEAALIRQEIDEALSYYHQAMLEAGKRHGNLASTGRQAAKIVAKLGLDWAPFAKCFVVPQVIAFQCPQVPEQSLTQAQLLGAIRSSIDTSRPVIAFALCDHDTSLDFLEAILGLGGDVAAVLSSDEFQSPSVDGDRFERLLPSCREVHRLGIQMSDGQIAETEYAERILIGLATMHSWQFGVKPLLRTLAINNSQESSAVELVEFELSEKSGKTRDASSAKDALAAGNQIVSIEPQIMSLLFADVKGFSRLKERQLLRFAREFLGKVSTFMHEHHAFPITRHTWGDGLFLTFESVHSAGLFALNLATMVDEVDWSSYGLPEDLSIRIGLHAGPVYECYDPISEKTTFMGVHVNHAARIEPITPPGNVYASEAFAALASAQDLEDFRCEYVGRTPLAKGFGMFSTYHVRQMQAK